MTKFKTIAEAFDFYKTQKIEDIEKRAKDIQELINTNAEADVEALNIESEGMEQAMEELRKSNTPKNTEFRGFNFLEGTKTTKVVKDMETKDLVSSEEYRSAFYKTLLNQKLTEQEQTVFQDVNETRGSGFINASEAAAVIPTATLNEIIKKASTMGGLIAHVRSFNMPTKIAIPVGTPATAAQWHTEGAEVQGDEVNVATVEFEANEILKVFSLSTKAKTMTIPAFEAYLVDELSNAVLACINTALVSGTGSGQGKGINTIVFDEGHKVEATTNIKYTDVVEVLAKTQQGYSAGAKWLMNNATLYRTFYGMVDGNKRPMFINDPRGEEVGKILGHDVIIDDNMPDNEIIFGNFDKYMGYNLPQGISLEVSTQSSFKKNLIDYKATALCDTKPLVEEAFVKLSIAA